MLREECLSSARILRLSCQVSLHHWPPACSGPIAPTLYFTSLYILYTRLQTQHLNAFIAIATVLFTWTLATSSPDSIPKGVTNGSFCNSISIPALMQKSLPSMHFNAALPNLRPVMGRVSQQQKRASPCAATDLNACAFLSVRAPNVGTVPSQILLSLSLPPENTHHPRS